MLNRLIKMNRKHVWWKSKNKIKGEEKDEEDLYDQILLNLINTAEKEGYQVDRTKINI